MMKTKKSADSFGTFLETVRSRSTERQVEPSSGNVQVRVLKALADHEPRMLKDLPKASGVSVSQLLDAIDKMIGFRLIEVVPSRDGLQLKITADGESLLR